MAEPLLHDHVFESAQEIANLDDPYSAFRSLLRHVSVYFQTGPVFVTVLDRPRQVLRVVASHDADAAQWQGFEYPFGIGVSGRAVAMSTRVALTDYRNDPGVDRSPELTDTIELESVVSAASVPIFVRGRARGAITLASRSSRDWTGQDLIALERFAALAAMVMKTYFNSSGEATTEAPSSWHRTMNRLRWAALQQQPDTQLSFWHELSERISATITLLTADGSIEGPALPKGIVEDAWKLSAAFDRAILTRISVHTEFREHAAWLHRIDINGELAGVVCVLIPSHSPSMSSHQISDIAFLSSLHLSIERLRLEAKQRHELHILEELLEAGATSSNDLTRRLVHYGLRLDQACTVMRIDAPSASLPRIQAAVVSSAAGRGTLIANHEDHLCLVVAGTLATRKSEQIFRQIADQFEQLLVAAVESDRGPLHISQAHELVRTLNETQAALEIEHGFVTPERFGLTSILFSLGDRGRIRRIITHQISPLLSYDADRGTNLVETAWQYLSKGKHGASTAKALHIHPNTLRQRLERIDDLIGSTWRQEPRTFEIYMALEAQRLIQENGSQSPNA